MLVALAACGGDGGPTTPPIDNSPATLTLTPSSGATLPSATTTTIVANVAARDGRALSAGAVQWSSSDAAIASVSGGTVTGVNVGSATITASLGVLTATVTVTVTPGAPVQVGVRTQPAGAAIGSVLSVQPVVEIRDAASNLVTSSNAAVTVAIASGGGTLGGMVTVSAVNGVVTFNGLSISGTAGDRTLTFTSTGLAPAVSQAFTMMLPAVPIIGVDNANVAIGAFRGTNPAAARVNITNQGSVPVTGLTIESTTYDAGGALGWLTPSLSGTTAPAVLTLTVSSTTLAEGSYHAVVRINGGNATNGPLSIGVTLTVSTSATVTYGASSERVKVLDVGASFAPTIALVDQSGAPTTVPVSYVSRSPGVATVGADGKITARATGDAWIVATASTSSDSLFVIVPNGAGPVVRTNVTNWSAKLGDTVFVTVLLDTRSATVGSAALAVDPEVPAPTLYSNPGTTPTPTVVLTTSGVIRVAIGSATGMTGAVPVLNLKITSRTAASGYVYLYGLDLAGVDGSSLTSSTTSTRLPIVFR